MGLEPPTTDPGHALLALVLAALAADLGTTTTQLAELLASPELTVKLAAIITNLEALEHLRALAARAPATAACRSLLNTDNPVEQRRVAATLLRAPIHAARPHWRTRSASEPLDLHPAAHRSSSHARPAAIQFDPPPPTPDQTQQSIESLLSLLLTPAPNPAPKTALETTPEAKARLAPTAFAAAPARTPCAPRTRVVPGQPPPAISTLTTTPAQPGTPVAIPSQYPTAPPLQRRTPPTRAADLLISAASTPRPHARSP